MIETVVFSMKQFDRIDIIFIILISIYLITLFIGILWLVLNKIEKKYWVNNKVTLENKAKEENISIKRTAKKPVNKTNLAKTTTTKKKTTYPKKTTSNKKAVSTAKTPKKTTTTKKKPNNSSKRTTGYVSPTKRKSNNKRKKKSSNKK